MGKKKIPALFSKTYDEKKFKKRILKYLYIKEYKEWVEDLFAKDDSGQYKPVEKDYSKKELKKMKAVAKSVKQNRGLVPAGKLLFLLVILGAVLVFNLLFKDMLIKNIAEDSLETVFGAKVSFSALTFRPEQARLYFGSLRVANKDQPMKNLFEMGRTELKLNMAELLKGKYIIENIECREIKWDTDRKYSGALAAKKPAKGAEKASKEKEKAAEPAAVSPLPGFSFDLDSIEIESILESQKENLKTVKQIEKVTTLVQSMQAKWTSEIEGYKGELTSLINTANSLHNAGISSVKSVAEAQAVYTEVESAVTQVQTLKTKVLGSKTEFEKDLKTAEEQKDKMLTTFEEDYKYLKSFIELPDQEKQAIIASIADKYLREQLGDFYTYGMKVVGYVKNMKLKSDKKGKDKKPARGKGYYVHFPGVTFPKFLLKQAALSFGDPSSESYLEINLNNLSSDPDLTAEPVSFKVKTIDKLGEMELDGNVDGRIDVEQPFTLNLELKEFPLVIEKGMEFLGVNSMSGDYTVTTSLVLNKAQEISGTIGVSLDNIRFSLNEATNIVTKELAKILTSVKTFSVDASYDILEAGKKVLVAADSDLDEIIMARVGALIGETVKEAEAQIRVVFDEFMEDKLKGHTELYNAVKEFGPLIDGDITTIAQYEQLLEKKKTELTNKMAEIKDLAESAVRDAAAAAEAAAKQKLEEEKAKAGAAAESAADKAADAFKSLF